MENIGLSGYPLKVHLFYYESDKVYISTNVHSSDQAWTRQDNNQTRFQQFRDTSDFANNQ